MYFQPQRLSVKHCKILKTEGIRQSLIQLSDLFTIKFVHVDSDQLHFKGRMEEVPPGTIDEKYNCTAIWTAF